MGYFYETHCHTCESSACSVLSPKDLTGYYSEKGYSGICLTDHFTGNSVLPDDTPWADRVGHYFDVYERTRREGARLGLSVFFGIEVSIVRDPDRLHSVTGNDFLIYGLTKEWLIENKGAFVGRPVENFTKIRAAGGFIIHAHPFSEARHIEYIRLLPRCVDAVEIWNAHINDEYNRRAGEYARLYNHVTSAGSDTHDVGQPLCALETAAPCETVGDLCDAIKNRRTKIAHVK